MSFVTADADTLTPTDAARSLWSADQMHGVAVSGAMARAIEQAVPRDDLRPARYTLDMFRPATMSPFTVETTVVREGRRICLVDEVLVQDGEPKVRASTIFLKPSEDPDGEVWQPCDNPSVPSGVPVLTEATIPWFASEKLWSQDFVEHQNSGRKAPPSYGGAGPARRALVRRRRDRRRSRHRLRSRRSDRPVDGDVPGQRPADRGLREARLQRGRHAGQPRLIPARLPDRVQCAS